MQEHTIAVDEIASKRVFRKADRHAGAPFLGEAGAEWAEVAGRWMQVCLKRPFCMMCAGAYSFIIAHQRFSEAGMRGARSVGEAGAEGVEVVGRLMQVGVQVAGASAAPAALSPGLQKPCKQQ